MQQPAVKKKVPGNIRKMLLEGEEVILTVKQSRWKAIFTPDTIIVTTNRVIRYSPEGFLGLHKEIEDYRFEDMANFKIKQGVMFAAVIISHRFMSETLTLDSLPKNEIPEFSKVVNEYMGKARGYATAKSAPPSKPPDALEVLKMRYARGEITKEQYEDMKRTLE
jgi:hypothetical protein